MNRRDFLRGVLGAAAVAAVPLPASAAPVPLTMEVGYFQGFKWIRTAEITASEVAVREVALDAAVEAILAPYYEAVSEAMANVVIHGNTAIKFNGKLAYRAAWTA